MSSLPLNHLAPELRPQPQLLLDRAMPSTFRPAAASRTPSRTVTPHRPPAPSVAADRGNTHASALVCPPATGGAPPFVNRPAAARGAAASVGPCGRHHADATANTIGISGLSSVNHSASSSSAGSEWGSVLSAFPAAARPAATPPSPWLPSPSHPSAVVTPAAQPAATPPYPNPVHDLPATAPPAPSPFTAQLSGELRLDIDADDDDDDDDDVRDAEAAGPSGQAVRARGTRGRLLHARLPTSVRRSSTPRGRSGTLATARRAVTPVRVAAKKQRSCAPNRPPWPEVAACEKRCCIVADPESGIEIVACANAPVGTAAACVSAFRGTGVVWCGRATTGPITSFAMALDIAAATPPHPAQRDLASPPRWRFRNVSSQFELDYEWKCPARTRKAVEATLVMSLADLRSSVSPDIAHIAELQAVQQLAAMANDGCVKLTVRVTGGVRADDAAPHHYDPALAPVPAWPAGLSHHE